MDGKRIAGLSDVPPVPEDFGALIKHQSQRWGRVIRDSGFKAE